MKAMIFAAGLGTRLQPLTNNTPKALILLNGLPLIYHTINKLKKYDVKEIIINVHHHAEQIIKYIQLQKSFQMKIEFSVEKKLLDTGGGLKQASWFFNDDNPFIVYNVDVLSDINIEEMLHSHDRENAAVTLAVKSRKSSRYLLFNNKNILCGWKSGKKGETKLVKNMQLDPNPLSFMGIHVVSPKIFSHLPLANTFSIIEAYLKMAKEGVKIVSYRADSAFWLDLGNLQNIKEAEQKLTNDSMI